MHVQLTVIVAGCQGTAWKIKQQSTGQVDTHNLHCNVRCSTQPTMACKFVLCGNCVCQPKEEPSVSHAAIRCQDAGPDNPCACAFCAHSLALFQTGHTHHDRRTASNQYGGVMIQLRRHIVSMRCRCTNCNPFKQICSRALSWA